MWTIKSGFGGEALPDAVILGKRQDLPKAAPGEAVQVEASWRRLNGSFSATDRPVAGREFGPCRKTTHRSRDLKGLNERSPEDPEFDHGSLLVQPALEGGWKAELAWLVLDHGT